MELRNRLANESAATAQAARQSTDQFLAILHSSGYAGFESAAQRLSPTLEVSFVAKSSDKAGGGFDLKVVKADAGVQYDQESVQKVTLKLAAVKDQLQPDNRFGPVRPKLADDRP